MFLSLSKAIWRPTKYCLCHCDGFLTLSKAIWRRRKYRLKVRKYRLKADFVTSAFVGQLLSFRSLKNDDRSGLQDYAENARACTGKIGGLSELNTLNRIAELA